MSKRNRKDIKMPGEVNRTPQPITLGGEEGKKDFRQMCKYGKDCYQKNPMHHQKFKHPKDDEPEPKNEASNEKTEEITKEVVDSPVAKKAKLDEAQESDKELNEKSEDKTKDDKTEDEQPSTSTKAVETSEEKSEPIEDDSESVPAYSEEKDAIKRVEMLFLTKMPEDFLPFWEFCKGVNRENPTEALLNTCGLRLVGPFDMVAGKEFKSTKLNDFLCHHRYYRDPPEFQTVIASTDESSNFHIGYFRDSPNEVPAFVASLGGKKGSADYENPKFVLLGDNLFAALYLHIGKIINDADPFKMTALQKLKGSVHLHATMKNQDQSFSLDAKTTGMKGRDKRKVAVTFHGAGLVVPYDKKSQVGYREIPESNADLKKILTKIVEAQDEEAKNKAFDALQELVTNVQFANDEGDPGMGLELGIDLLVFGGNCFNSTTRHLLTVAYSLLNRDAFGKIANAHLNRRKEKQPFFQAE